MIQLDVLFDVFYIILLLYVFILMYLFITNVASIQLSGEKVNFGSLYNKISGTDWGSYKSLSGDIIILTELVKCSHIHFYFNLTSFLYLLHVSYIVLMLCGCKTTLLVPPFCRFPFPFKSC